MPQKKQTANKSPAMTADEKRKAKLKERTVGEVVIDYADLDENDPLQAKLKNFMDRAMENIAEEPDVYDHISKFGSEPYAAMDELIKDINERMRHYDEAVNVVMTATDYVKEELKKGYYAGVGERTKRVAKDVQKRALKGGKKALYKATAVVTRRRLEKDKEALKEVANQVPELQQKIDEMSVKIEQADVGLNAVSSDIEQLGTMRNKLLKQFNVYLGAIPELKRRYEEVYMPEAQKASEESPENQELRSYAEAVEESFVSLTRRAAQIENQRALCIRSMLQMSILQQNITQQRQKMSDIRNNILPELHAMLSEAQMARTVLKVSESIDEFDKIGDQTLDSITKISQGSIEMTTKSLNKGAVDPTRTIDSINQIRGAIESSRKNAHAEMNKNLEAARELRKAGDGALEAKKESSRKTLEQAKGKPEAPRKVAGNDNEKGNKGSSFLDDMEADAQERPRSKKRAAGNKPTA